MLTLFSLPFVGAGVAFLVMASRQAAGRPTRVPIIAAIMFGGAGLCVLGQGIGGLIRSRRIRSRRSRYPGEPWMAEIAWNPRGIGDEQGRGVVQWAVAGLGFAAFTACWQALATGMGAREWAQGGWILMLGTSAFWLIALGCGLAALRRLIRRTRGRGYLRFERFPFLLGQTVQARFDGPAGLSGVESVRFILRAIDERRVCEKGDEHSTLVHRELWRAESDVPVRGPVKGVPVQFDLPRDGVTTQLTGAPVTYWELEVEAVGQRKYSSTFLLPVYAPVT